MTPKLAKTFGYENSGGVLVENPIDDGPATAAGIQRGDIITKIDGDDVKSADELRRRVASLPPGTTLQVEIFRNNKHHDYEITLAELPDTASASRNSSQSAEDELAVNKEARVLRKLGLESVATLTDQLARKLEIEFQPAVVVRSVRTQSAVAEAGVGPKDLITDVMGVPITSVEGWIEELNKHDLTKGIRVSVNPTRHAQVRLLGATGKIILQVRPSIDQGSRLLE